MTTKEFIEIGFDMGLEVRPKGYDHRQIFQTPYEIGEIAGVTGALRGEYPDRIPDDVHNCNRGLHVWANENDRCIHCNVSRIVFLNYRR